MKPKNKRHLMQQKRTRGCLLLVTCEEQSDVVSYSFKVYIKDAPTSEEGTFTMTFSMSYIDLVECMSHALFMLDLVADINEYLQDGSTEEKIKLLFYARTKINLRYLDLLEGEISHRRGRGIPGPLLPGSDKIMNDRRNFWKNGQTRWHGTDLPRETDFIWDKYSKLPNFHNNLGSS